VNFDCPGITKWLAFESQGAMNGGWVLGGRAGCWVSPFELMADG
jgi:hypothetical protein